MTNSALDMQKSANITNNAFGRGSLTTEIIQDVMPLFSNGQVRPFVFHTYDGSSSADDLELSANLAHEMMESSQHIGKIALQLSSIHGHVYVCNKSKK